MQVVEFSEQSLLSLFSNTLPIFVISPLILKDDLFASCHL